LIGGIAGGAIAVVAAAVAFVSCQWLSLNGSEQSSLDDEEQLGTENAQPETHEATETYLGDGTFVGTVPDDLAGDVGVETADNGWAFESMALRR
jgi:hypothetical protein